MRFSQLRCCSSDRQLVALWRSVLHLEEGDRRNLRLLLVLTAYEGFGAMEAVDTVVRPVKEFAKDSVRLVTRCHKPDRKEFSKVALRTGLGFVVMGCVGFFVKLIFIPINNIIIGSA